ncbi:AAA family ATPase [Patescibacteria group bacterium]|nr:AAA family ATPase [Patescibacteria group bacterium]
MNYWTIGIIVIVALAFLFYLSRNKGLFKLLSKSAGQGGSILMLYARDLTKLAQEGKLDPVIGREEEITKVIQVLSRRTKNNPVLLGEAGVGKTAIVEGLADAIIKKKVPEVILNKKVLALDLSGIVAGTKYRGEFEERLKKIVNEIIFREREIILFIDEIHSISGAGEATGAINAVDILKPALARGELQVVGATTISEFKKYIEPDVTLERRFHPIIVDEPTKEETIDILMGIKQKYEEYHKVRIPNEIIDDIVELASDIKGRMYPDKAIDLMDEAAAKVSLQLIRNGRSQINPEVALKVVQEVHDEWAETNKAV